MSKPKEQPLETWDQCLKAFVRSVEALAGPCDSHTVFRDFCRAASLSMRGATTTSQTAAQAIEDEYAALAGKHGAATMERFAEMLAIVVTALEIRRADFLGGPVYEALGATRSKDMGQILTPPHVARLMAKVCLDRPVVKDRIVTLYDCCAGAGVLLLEAAEEYIARGGRQRDVYIAAEDLDPCACDIAFIQFTLLGYAATVTWMNSLTRRVHGGPWHTIGYFLHGTCWRLPAQRRDEAAATP